MFNNLDPKNKDIDDIFADTDSAQPEAPIAPTPPRPSVSPLPTAINNSAVSAAPATISPDLEESNSKSKMVRVLKKFFIFIVVLALIGAAAYFIYAKFLINEVSDLQDDNVINTSTPITPIVETPIVPVEVIINTTTVATTTPTRVDADNDGLSDVEEQVLGTDLNNIDTDSDGLSDGDEVKNYLTSPILADTDGDGLTDGQEVNNYKTNPNNSDTDGDTYQDGAEVKAGYDPLTKPVK